MKAYVTRNEQVKMSKFVLFGCAIVCNIFAIRSNPIERSNVSITESPSSLLAENGSSRKNETEWPCSCSLNVTSFVTTPPPLLPTLPLTQDRQEIHNFLSPTSNSGFIWKCNLVARRVMRDDYHCTPGIGSHKLHTRAKIWNEARKICIDEGGHLAIVNSVAEANVLVNLFNRSGPIKGAAYKNQVLLGIHDLYAETEWVTVQGDSLAKSGYSAWTDKWGGQPDNGGGIQNCGAMVIEDGRLDDVACNVPFAFFCEISDT